jgi:predicted transcriptional regulator
VAEHAEEQKQEEPAALAARTTELVAAYVARNTVAMADLGHVIETVRRALKTLGREDTRQATAKPAPAVPVRRSMQEDHLVCLVCGKRQKTLRRHLNVVHQLTPEAYRERFGLKSDYPWPRRATRDSVPRWPSASAWVVAGKRHQDASSP